MENRDFNIHISEFTDNIYKKFGVYSGSVTPPFNYFCKSGERMFSRFFYIRSGTLIFDNGTKKAVTANAGDIVYLPNDISYISDWIGDENGSYIAVHFILEEFYLKLPLYICIAAHDNNKIFLNMFQHMDKIWKDGKRGYELETLSEFYHLINLLYLDNISKKTKENYSKIYEAILFIENNYINDFSISELAGMCYVSESTFRRLFLEYKNMPPITYRNYLRIRKAYTLIASGEYSVTEAASAVNIFDLCYFNRLFKYFMGISPSKAKPHFNCSPAHQQSSP